MQPACAPAWNQFVGFDRISSTIHASTKGPDGMIYLGGRDGLYRLEGGNVKAWLPDFTDEKSLPSGKIKGLANDEHFIWIGTNSGIARFDTHSGEMERSDGLNQAMGYPIVNSLLVHDQYLFVGAQSGAYVIKRADDIVQLSVVAEFTDTGSVNALLMHDTSVLTAGEDGLWAIGADAAPRRFGLANTKLVAALTIENTLWAMSSDALFKFEPDASDWERFTADAVRGLPDTELLAFASDRRGRLWIGSRRGIARWDLNYAHPIACVNTMSGNSRAQDVSIAHLSAELGDYLFYGTSGRGAAFAPDTDDVQLIFPTGWEGLGLPNAPIWSHYIDSRGRFLAGTTRGLFIEQSAGNKRFEPVDQSVLGDLRIYSLAETLSEENDNRIWIGSTDGLYVYSDNLVEPVRLFVDADGKELRPPVFAIKQHKQKLYVGTSNGLAVLNMLTKGVEAVFTTKAEVFPPSDVPRVPLPIARVWSIDFSGDKVFVVGQDGALQLDVLHHTIVGSSQSSPTVMRQPLGYLYNVVVVGDNRLFLGTESGLIETDFAFENYQQISEINGRRLLSVMSSGRDSFGNIWMGVANSGLFRYSPTTQEWTHITQSSGLITNGVSQLGLSFSTDGKMSVSNATGASIVDLNRIELGGKLPFQVRLNEPNRNHLFAENETFYIGPQDRDLSLSFMPTDLVESGLYNVAFEMIADEEIQRTSVVPFDEMLSFVNLAPGAYTFRASVNASSGASSELVSATVVVRPYWWETTAFYVLLACLLLIVIAAYLYYRTRLVEQHQNIISQERKRIAQELHDTSLQDLFGAKMLGKTLLLDLTAEQDKQQTNRVLGLIDTAIKSLRNSVDSLSSLTDVPELSVALAGLRGAVHMPAKTDYVFEEQGSPWRVGRHRRFFVYRMIREAVNNAAKHANAEVILVTLQWSWLGLNIIVEDDGQGFDVQAGLASDTYGLNCMHTMANSAKVTLRLNSKPGEGTKVEIGVLRFVL